VQDSLTVLADRLEAVTLRIQTLGLARAAEDLRKVATELRRLARALAAPEVPGGAQPQDAAPLGISNQPT
jgi:hypothetical protein